MPTATQEPSTSPRLCVRCKKQAALYEVRSEPVCGTCFAAFVRVKAAKRFEVVDRESRNTVGRGVAHYLLGLSFGPSSSAMVSIFDELDERSAKKRRPVSSSFCVVHVDTTILGDTPAADLSQRLARWSVTYPRFNFETVPLTAALSLSSIDWAALPRMDPALPPEGQLLGLFDALRSSTSRTDVARLFVRHILMSIAVRDSCCALLLGNSTTSLAALTLAETAKGRGFSLPWLTSDGTHPIMDWRDGRDSGESTTAGTVVVHFPLRELYRKELIVYSGIVEMDKELGIHGDGRTSNSVVSHKNQSIDDVMARYFGEVELSYPSVVANVVRTAGKLSRGEPSHRCGLCGAAVDLREDQTWRGEMGDVDTGDSVSPDAVSGRHKICYGCDRSLNG